jgi:NADH dehydrogenase FAD-containing subunit
MRLALVGAGHAHLAAIAQASRLRAAGLDPILIAPATFDYSGLASGVLSGALPRDSARIDVAAVCRSHGMAHLVGQVTSVDPGGGKLTLADGSVHAFDAVSFNIGSEVADPGGWIGREGVWPVKPLASLLALRAALETAFATGVPTPAVVVLGDGPTGFEIAAALTGLHERHGRAANLTLIGPAPDARWAPGRASEVLTRNLDRRGVVRIAGEARAHQEGRLDLSDGRTLALDHLVLATGLMAPALTQTLDVPLDALGRIVVRPTLSSVGDDRLFAVGDCGSIVGSPRPFAGVFGVRAAEALIHNLCALGTAGPVRPYRPQSRWLSILDLGDGTGLGLRSGLWWQGRSALALKRRLDLGFVARHRI